MTKENKRPVGRPPVEKPATRRFNMRVTEEQHQAWSDAAISDGYEKGGEANVSAWLKDLADNKAKSNQ